MQPRPRQSVARNLLLALLLLLWLRRLWSQWRLPSLKCLARHVKDKERAQIHLASLPVGYRLAPCRWLGHDIPECLR